MGMNNSMNMMMPYTTSMMGAGMSDMMNLNTMMPYSSSVTHPSMASNTTTANNDDNNNMLPPSNNTAPKNNNTPFIDTNEDANWEERYRELQLFRAEHGHCRVPARYKKNLKLGRWVMTQRRQFTMLMQGLPSALTTERMNRLNDIGFVWMLRADPVTMWNKKFAELKEYKDQFGNCMVPQRYQREFCFFFTFVFFPPPFIFYMQWFQD